MAGKGQSVVWSAALRGLRTCPGVWHLDMAGKARSQGPDDLVHTPFEWAVERDVGDAAGVEIRLLSELEAVRLAAGHLAPAVLLPREVVEAEEPAVVPHDRLGELPETSVGTAEGTQAPMECRPRVRVAEDEAACVRTQRLLALVLGLRDVQIVGK